MSSSATPIVCPNCSQTVDSLPIRCPRCGYRSELAGEYLWLYAGGGLLMTLGFALGATSLAVRGAGTTHWSHALLGWYPLGPWSSTWHWLAFLTEGILLTLAGMGWTRHRWSAWWLAIAVLLTDAAFAVIALLRAETARTAPWVPILVIVGCVAILALALRAGLALRRTPPRDIERLQAK